MRIVFLWCIAILAFCTNVNAQIAINNDGTAANSTAALDVKFTNRGFLPPRLSTVQRNAIVSPATGLTIYNTSLKCLEFYTGPDNGWYSPCQSGWSVSGNSGTADGVNFIGTTDNVPFTIKVNNQQAGKIDHQTGNTFYGYQAGKSNLMGQHNTATGYQALYSNTYGSYNTAYGSKTLYSNISGAENTAVGYSGLYSNTTGSNNTAMGYMAMFQNLTGNNNTAIGRASLYSNTIGFDNTALGDSALYKNLDGNWNTAIGTSSLKNNVHATHNTAVGTNALYSNTVSYNTAVGSDALKVNTTGQYNTAAGFSALLNNNGSNNSAFGFRALANLTTGNGNSAFGKEALYNPNSGNAVAASFNTAFGRGALTTNKTGTMNTGFGFYALFANTTGSFNTAVGDLALWYGQTGTCNTAIGRNTLSKNYTGASNNAAGNNALKGNESGSYNTVCGADAFYIPVASNYVTAVGYSTGYGASNLVNSASLGYNAGNNSNKVSLGNTSVSWIGGQVGWSVLSDERFKRNIKANIPGLVFILKLKPVTYSWNIKKLDRFLKVPDSLNSPEIMQEAISLQESVSYTGFLAQEVEKAAKKTGYNFSGLIKPQDNGSPYGLSYDCFVVPLVKGMQDLNAATVLCGNSVMEEKKVLDGIDKSVENLISRLDELKRIIKK